MRSILRDFFISLWEVFKLPLFLVGEGFQRLFHLGWRKLFMFIVASVILTVVFSSTFFEVTSQPGFCGSCHIMRPYIEAWKTSSHRDVNCMECHARTGITGYVETKFTAISMLANYATGLYKRSKPWAEIEDDNCLECHDTRLLDGKIEFGDVIFDHTPHLTDTRRGRKLRCTSCHSQIVQGEHISVTSSTCFLCHFKNVQQEGREELAECVRCHKNPPSGEEAVQAGMYDHSLVVEQDIDCRSCHKMMWQGRGGVRRERCGVCHSQTAHIDRINDLEFVHEWHLEKRKVDCQQCHDPIEHRMTTEAAIVRNDCQGCHEDTHKSILAMRYGEGSRLLETAMPERMHESGVVCMSCHKDPVTGQGIAGVNKSACTPCHNASYYRLAHNWRKAFNRRIAKLERAMRTAGAHRRIEDARHDLALIKKGGAWHNPRFAEAVLNEVAVVVSEAGGTPPRHPELPQGSQACLTCHVGITEVPVSLMWSPFDHNAHLIRREITCGQCHYGGEPETNGHGRLMPAGSQCSECHHRERVQQPPLCAPCHQPARRLYTADIPELTAEPSPMAGMDISCSDCHDEDNNYSPPDGSFCLDCHDQEVVSDLDFVRGELLNALRSRESSRDSLFRLVEKDKGRAVHHPDLALRILTR